MTRPGALLTAMSLGLIATVTLWPFAFDPRWLSWAEYATAFELPPRSMFDFPRNIVLFMPLGAGVAILAEGSGRSWWRTALFSGGAGLVASACVETLQIFLPARTPSVADIAANALGAAAGCLAHRRWRTQVALVAVPARPPMPRVHAAAFGVYLLLMVLVTWVLMWGVRPQGWDATYELATSARSADQAPWRGTVRDLLVLDRAVDDATARQLLKSEIPPSVKASLLAKSSGVGETVSGVLLADRINQSKQFAIVMTVTTFDLTQEDPAPIVTSSADPSVGNLLLGQDEAHLILRWRSRLTRANHMEPAVEFPGVFRSLEPMRLVVTFDGFAVRLHTFREDAEILLGPEAVFSAMLRETSCWPVRPSRFAWWAATVPLSATIFLPLGMLLSPALAMARRRRSRMVAVVAGLCLPALMVEAFVASYRRGELRLDVLLLGIVLTCLGFGTQRLYRAWYSSRHRADTV